MKTLFMCLALALTFLVARAADTDSATYNLQRKKINMLLAERSAKFSQYSQSLNTKTGIFGWQTKKDIRRSGEILMDIAKTDEVIFREIKVLLDFKTFQTTQVIAKSNDSEDRSYNYMVTINKLRQQNEQLELQRAQEVNQYRQKQTIHVIIILLLILTSIFLFFRKSPVNKA
ncbi:hypothetical protein BDD43_3483 [Mucilaginibacter gracilis]|uniref:Uncharacterized protein n=1 Tax=Mucilaginibacter gracilis TaxID=423350 RepID=A0A495J5M2_9SPHI|nr:hypothetical protein [Mucilaginibacter gracilis]RKR83279.1 hypothetical protein BDD43_3483 [Mucilaginibacter gracilis]